MIDYKMNAIEPLRGTADSGQRLGFTLHVLGYVLVSTFLALIFPLALPAIVLRSLLLAMLCLHLYVLLVPALHLELVPLPIHETPPLLPDGRRDVICSDDDQLWYRWHNIS